MAYADLGASIADRMVKRGGPALLFEQVAGSPMPVLINAFGSPARMNLALAGAILCLLVGTPRRLQTPEPSPVP